MIWELLGLSFLGGLVLNVLPCVLPVIPIKILSWAKQSQENGAPKTALAGLYSLGILVSFIILGLMCSIALAAGHYWGFGFQLDSPWITGFLSALLAFMGLRLLGALHIKRPEGKPGWGARLWEKCIGGPLNGLLEYIKKKGPYIRAFGEG